MRRERRYLLSLNRVLNVVNPQQLARRAEPDEDHIDPGRRWLIAQSGEIRERGAQHPPLLRRRDRERRPAEPFAAPCAHLDQRKRTIVARDDINLAPRPNVDVRRSDLVPMPRR